MTGGEMVTCATCKKPLQKVAAVAINGVWTHAAAACFGPSMRDGTAPLRELRRQLGLFEGGKAGKR